MTFGALLAPKIHPKFRSAARNCNWSPLWCPSGNEGLGKDHVEEFLETFCAFGGLQNGVAKHFFGELLWDVRAKNARARS